MTKWLRYDGPREHALTLTVSDDLILGLGSAAPVDDDLAQTLLDSPDIYGVVTVINPPKADKPAAADTKEK